MLSIEVKKIFIKKKFVIILINLNHQKKMFFFSFQPIEEALRYESAFLQKNYPSIASRNGTPFLAKTLNRV